MELVEFKLREGSKLDGLRLNDFRSRYSEGILICAVEREGSVTIPERRFCARRRGLCHRGRCAA